MMLDAVERTNSVQMRLSCLVALVVLQFTGCTEHPRLQTISMQDGYEVRILGESSWEYQQRFYYELWKDGRKIRGPLFFDAGEEKSYRVKEAKDGRGFVILVRGTDEALTEIKEP